MYMHVPSWKKRLPNQLSQLRLCFGALTTIAFFHFDYFALALVSILFFTLTDWADGYLARRWKVSTSREKNILKNGRYLDPLADKAFLLPILIYLGPPPMLMLQFFLLLMIEGALILVGFIGISTGREGGSSICGKIKFNVQVFFALLLFTHYFLVDVHYTILVSVLWTAIFLGFFSFCGYLKKYFA